MNALKKIKILEERKKKEGYTGPYLLDISTEENRWTEEEIKKLETEYSFLPKYYIDFLKVYDSLGIGWFVFFGSKSSDIIPIWEEIRYWQDNSKGEYFPFGKDVAGSIFVFNKKGEIIKFNIEDYQWEHPIFIACNLEDFIRDCLLGKRYGEFDKTANNTFYDFLKSQGWA